METDAPLIAKLNQDFTAQTEHVLLAFLIVLYVLRAQIVSNVILIQHGTALFVKQIALYKAVSPAKYFPIIVKYVLIAFQDMLWSTIYVFLSVETAWSCQAKLATMEI